MSDSEPNTVGPVDSHGVDSSPDSSIIEESKQDILRRGGESVATFVVPVALVGLVLLAFMPALSAGFAYWDDDKLLLTNDRYRELSADSLKWMLTTSFAGHFQPLTWLSYWLDYKIWWQDSFGFHLTNVLWHMATAVAFYFLARTLLTVGLNESVTRRGHRVVICAGIAAALFAIHPLRAESVAWIAERRDVLSGFFFVVSITAYMQFRLNRNKSHIGKRADVDNDSVPTEQLGRSTCQNKSDNHIAEFDVSQDVCAAVRSKGSVWYWLSVALCACSLLAKASAVMLPLALLVIDVFPLRRLARDQGKLARNLCGLIFEKMPFIVLAGFAAIRALVAQEQGRALYSLEQHDVVSRFAQACYGLVFYPLKTVLPLNLGPLYPIPPRSELLGVMFWVSLVALVIVCVIVMRFRRVWPALLAAISYYVIMVAPVLGFVQSGPQLVADRYSYLSCLGFSLLGGVIALKVMSSPWYARRSERRAIFLLGVASVLTLLTHATFRQNDYWQEPRGLWTRAVAVAPKNPIALVNLGDAYARFGSIGYDHAEHLYKNALELEPNDSVAHHHLATIYDLTGRPESAIRHYVYALKVDPNRTSACFSLGRLLARRGDGNLAVKVLMDGLQRNPGAIEIIELSAELFATYPDASVRNGEEAVRLAKLAIGRRGADHPLSLLLLATAYAEMEEFEKAIASAEAAGLAVQKDNEQLHNEIQKRLTLFRAGRPFHETDFSSRLR